MNSFRSALERAARRRSDREREQHEAAEALRERKRREVRAAKLGAKNLEAAQRAKVEAQRQQNIQDSIQRESARKQRLRAHVARGLYRSTRGWIDIDGRMASEEMIALHKELTR